MSFLYHRGANSQHGFYQALAVSYNAQGKKDQEEKDKEPPVRIKIKDDE